MVSFTPLETKRRLYKQPEVCTIRVCRHSGEPPYPGVTMELGLVPNLNRVDKKSTVHIARSGNPSYINPGPKKSDMDCWVIPRDRANIAF